MPDLDAHVTNLSGTCTFSQADDAEAPERRTGTDADATDGPDETAPAPDDPDGAATEPDDQAWACPRGALDGHDRCLFHLTPTERRELDVGPGEVAEALATAVQSRGEAVKQFRGATLASLDLSHRRLAAPDNYPIDLRDARVDGAFSLTNVDLGQPLHCDHARLDCLEIADARVRSRCTFASARVAGDVTLENQFSRVIDFDEAVVEGDFSGDPAVFERGLSCRGTVFEGDVEFYADFNDEPSFTGATFRGETSFFVDVNADSYFKDATFEGPFDLYAAFTGSTRFNGATFRDRFDFYGRVDADAHFPGATFEGPASFYRAGEEGRATRFYQFANFEGATFEDEADFTRVEFGGGAVFEGVTFRGLARFDESRFDRRCRFVDVAIADRLRFREAVFSGTPVLEPSPASTRRTIDCTAARLTSGRIHLPDDPLVVDLSRANVGDVTIETEPGGTVFDHLVVDRTDFEGFDFSAHRLELAQRDYRIHGTKVHDEGGRADGGERADDGGERADDGGGRADTSGRRADDGRPRGDHGPSTAASTGGAPSPEDLEVTYMKAKNGAKGIDENEAIVQFFLREMRYRRHRHLQTLAASGSLRSRLRVGGRAAMNFVMGLTCGFGERPWRVIASSVGVVALFAVLYAVFGVPVPHEPPVVGYAILSTETFVALVLGAPPITTPAVNMLTSTEAFAGAYFIALFVFTLTRSIRR